MSRWLITTNPDVATPETVWVMKGTAQDAAEAVSEKSTTLGKTLSVWKLQGHTELDITVNLIQED